MVPGRSASHAAAGIAGVALLVLGVTFAWRLAASEDDGALAKAFVQLGSLGLVATGASLGLLFLHPEARRKVLLRGARTIAVIAAFVLIAFALGEGFLRLVYRDGLSFGSHGGPLVERFERDFAYNRFDGPSRGPDVEGPKRSHELRILVQGDSLTWGQGVRDEALLYTNRLLEKLKAANREFELAVLAKPGREIDEHIAQLQQWGREIQPDVIIYQWFINDMELDKSNRPRPTGRIWRRAFFHGPLMRWSYLWFLLDYRLDLLLPSDAQPYREYVLANFGPGTAGWSVFTDLLGVWISEAKRLTSKVVIMMYSHPRSLATFAGIHAGIARLCERSGVVAIDLTPLMATRFEGNEAQIHASPFDGHPSPSVHALIADVLHARLGKSWPELFRY